MAVMNIWFASNNAHKKEELQAILKTTLKIPSAEGLSFDPEETGNTFYDNALIKARALKSLLVSSGNPNDIVIADDSGLCVDGLAGRPGVQSAYYAFENGKKITSTEQNIMLLDELGDNPVRSARFVCCMVLLFDNDRFYIIQETLEGQIVKKTEMRGGGGFGYDPIFLLPQFNRTLAEVSAEDKNSLSHRGKAGKQLARFLIN